MWDRGVTTLFQLGDDTGVSGPSPFGWTRVFTKYNYGPCRKVFGFDNIGVGNVTKQDGTLLTQAQILADNPGIFVSPT